MFQVTMCHTHHTESCHNAVELIKKLALAAGLGWALTPLSDPIMYICKYPLRSLVQAGPPNPVPADQSKSKNATTLKTTGTISNRSH